jgi:hypothetical protein
MASPRQTAKTLPSYILEISVGQCKSLGIDVRYAPVVDVHDPNYNLAHCLLVLPSDIKKSEIVTLRADFLKAAICRLVESDPDSS